MMTSEEIAQMRAVSQTCNKAWRYTSSRKAQDALSDASDAIRALCAEVIRLTEERAAMAGELARVRDVVARIDEKAFMNAGEFPRYVREELAALSHTGMTGSSK